MVFAFYEPFLPESRLLRTRVLDPDPGGSVIFSPLGSGSGSRGSENDKFCYNNWGLSRGMKRILRQFTKKCIPMAESTSF